MIIMESSNYWGETQITRAAKWVAIWEVLGLAIVCSTIKKRPRIESIHEYRGYLAQCILMSTVSDFPFQ